MKGLSRAIAFAFAVLAFVMLIVDGTTSIAGESISLTRIADVVTRLGDAQTLTRWQTAISNRVHPFAWSAVRTMVLPQPAIAVALVAMAGFLALGRREAPDFDMRPRDELR